MEKELRALRAGEITWSAFAATTNSQWERLAGHVIKKSKQVPSTVSIEDVKQELLVGAWRFMRRWEEGRGSSLHKWVVTGACHSARTWIETQRESKRRHSSSPSRAPLLVGDLSRGVDLDDEFDCIVWVEAVQEDICAAKESARNVMESAYGQVEKECVVAFIEAGGDYEATADRLFGDPRSRRVCRLGSREEVRGVVRRSVVSAIERSSAQHQH